MRQFNHDTVVPYRDSGLTKKQQIADMFNQIAFRYDFLNRFLSGGIDKYWRKKAIRELAPFHPDSILDVATGTGDVAILMAKYLQPKKIIGIDISYGMLEIGKKKLAKLRLQEMIELKSGDSESIDFEDDSFDAVTVAFGVRNFEHLQKGLWEIGRVLKPGGKLVILEFSKPRKKGFKKLYQAYLQRIAPSLGKLISKNRDAYRYLNDSVSAFPEGADFINILNISGYEHTYQKRLSLGICSIYGATKPAHGGWRHDFSNQIIQS
jgi:demethylmenaquinone methyltransferase / 2-methoxy-6-polyprenyl-1,4-benzoquinol methylase